MSHEPTRGPWLTSSAHTGTTTSTRTRTAADAGSASAVRVRRSRRLKRWWRRSRRIVLRRWNIATRAVTPLGWFVLGVAVIGLIAGLAFDWIEAWFVAAAAAVLLLIALPFLTGTRAYRTALELSRAHVVAGGEVQLSVEVQNAVARPQLPAVIELPVGDALREVPVPMLGPHQSASLPVAVPTNRRGVIQIGPLTVAKQDPLALLRRELTWRERHLLHVHPRTVLLPPNSAGLVRDLEGQASRRLSDSDLSFHAVREYLPGDAMRHIHWKSTAKTGNLMVRQYEESQTARVAVLFDARREEYASDDEFELGVSVAASISAQAVREGRERFIASAWAPGLIRPSVDGLEELPSRDSVQLLDAWAELQPAADAPPVELLARSLARSIRHLSIVVIVTGSIPAIGRLHRAAVAFSEDVQVLAVRAEQLAEPGARRLDGMGVATVGQLGDLPQLLMRGIS